MKKTWKKLTACALAVALAAGMIPTPVQAASAHEGGTISSDQIVAPVYNQTVYDYLKELGDNMIAPPGYATYNSASGSVGPLFRAYEYQGHQQALAYNGGGGYNLVVPTTLNRASVWEMAAYDLDKPAWFLKVRENSDVKMRLGGSLINGASMTILDRESGKVLGTHQGQSGKTTTTTTDVPVGDKLQTTGKIEDPFIALIDNTAPEIRSVEGDDDKITLFFDEEIRFANGASHYSLGGYTITVKVAHAGSGVEWGSLNYSAESVDTDDCSITFRRVSEAPPAGEYKIVEITGASNAAKDQKFEVYGIKQCWQFSLSTNDKRGTPDYGKPIFYNPSPNNGIKLIGEMEDMAPLSDLAGNAVSLPGELDLRQYNIGFDTKAPVLEEIYLTGDMITDDSEKPKDQWAEDTDLSSLYAGVGDSLYFNLKFSEVMREVSGRSVTLNVMNGDRNVTLSNPTGVTSTNANGETCTVLRFGPFTPVQSMTMAAGSEGQPIGVSALNGTYDDLAYNDWDGNIPVCAQGIYLDTVAPAVTAELMSGAGKRELTVKLTVADETSGFIGLNGKVGLSAVAEETVAYQYALNDSLSADPDDYTNGGVALGGSTVSWHDIDLYNDTRYLHIKLL